jgi:transposase
VPSLDRLSRSLADLIRIVTTLRRQGVGFKARQAKSMPGWGRRAAQDAAAETGVGMSSLATGAHLVSWAGRTPLDNQSSASTRR